MREVERESCSGVVVLQFCLSVLKAPTTTSGAVPKTKTKGCQEVVNIGISRTLVGKKE